MLYTKTYLDHVSTVKKVDAHQMYLWVFKGAFGAVAVVIGTFHSTSFGQKMMANAEDNKLELIVAVMALFVAMVAWLWALFPARC